MNLLGVVYDSRNRKILIGRRENDEYIKELAWSFPGGRPEYSDELEDNLKLEIKKKTSLDVEVGQVIFAKTYPEKREFLSVYFLCALMDGEARPGEKFVELKWVKPSDVENYFTTSLHPNLLEYLKTLD